MFEEVWADCSGRHLGLLREGTVNELDKITALYRNLPDDATHLEIQRALQALNVILCEWEPDETERLRAEEIAQDLWLMLWRP